MKKSILSFFLASLAYCLPAQINFQGGSYYFNDAAATSSTFDPTINFGTSLGGNNTISADYATALGNYNSVSGYASTASGVYVQTNGLWSHSWGSFVETNGDQSFTFGAGDLLTTFKNPHNKTFAVGWKPGPPAFVVQQVNTDQYVGIGAFFPQNRLHITTNDEEGINLMSSGTSQRSVINFMDEVGAKNWNITAYNDFIGGYGNILEIRSHRGGNLWVRGTTMMVGDFFDFDGCPDCADFKLFVKGGVRTEQVKVDMSAGKWADYVFEEDYNLLSLKEVKAHIAENGHLPAMPSAKEVEDQGVNLGEMDAKLLEKIEELTLYIIDQEARISQLEGQLNPIQPQDQ